MTARIRGECRICGSSLTDFLALGEQPLANQLPVAGSTVPVARFPLTMARCTDCGLIQLREALDTAVLFSDYAYVPSTSSTMREHFKVLAQVMCSRLALSPADLVVDVGSNDGLLLSFFQQRGIRVHGVEVAENLAAAANAKGIPTTAAPISLSLADALRREHGAASLVTATNVFAHVDDVRSFLQAAVALLAPTGVFIVEVQSFAETAKSLAFDMTYHEHMSYYTTRSLQRLCRVVGVELLDVEVIPTHGGSLRATIGRAGHPLARPDHVESRIAAEEPLVGAAGCLAFAQGVKSLRESLRALVADVRSQGGRIAAYGAPAKATVLLNYVGLSGHEVAYVVDRNPAKQGREIPGTGIPVVGVDRLEAEPPSHLLLLAWNLAEEILAEQRAFRERGGQFIVPVPVPRVLA